MIPSLFLPSSMQILNKTLPFTSTPSFMNLNSSPFSTSQTLFASGHEANKIPTLMELFKQNFQQAVSQNETIQKNMSQIQENDAIKFLEKTKETLRPYSESIIEELDKGSQMISDATLKLVQTAAVQAAAEFSLNTAQTLANQKIIKFILDELTEEARERKKLHYFFRSDYGRKQDLKNGIYYNPYTGKMEKANKMEENEAAQEVVIFDVNRGRNTSLHKLARRIAKSAKQFEDSENVVSKASKALLTATSNTVSFVGDTVFKPTEESEVFSAIKKRDETFDLQIFLNDLTNNIFPTVLMAYFNDDVETLKRHCTKECYLAQFYPRIQERVFSKLKFDTRILSIDHVDLMSARFIEDNPVLVMSSECQYIYCLKDNFGKGSIVEGRKDDIRKESILWIFRQDPTGNTRDWEVCDISFGGNIKLMA